MDFRAIGRLGEYRAVEWTGICRDFMDFLGYWVIGRGFGDRVGLLWAYCGIG
jgi:hypothetical protein